MSLTPSTTFTGNVGEWGGASVFEGQGSGIFFLRTTRVVNF
jgi:hypothetical protein